MLPRRCRGMGEAPAALAPKNRRIWTSELQNILLTITQIRTIRLPSPCRHEGRCASSRNVVRVAMGRLQRQVLLWALDETLRRTVKSCGPGAATLASIPAGLCWQGNGGKKGRSPGRARSKPSNHCAGKAGLTWLYLSNPCAPSTTHCTRCCGCRRHPAFPAPSLRECATKDARPGLFAPRDRARLLFDNQIGNRAPFLLHIPGGSNR